MNPGLFPFLSLCLLVGPVFSADLASRVQQLARQVPAGAVLAVSVARVDTGVTLVNRGGDTAMTPASIQKIAITAAALDTLGVDYHFSTRLVALGPVVAGVAPGLAVIGEGSPCLDEHFSERQPDRIFANWAAQLRSKGIQRIGGDLVIDNSAFAGPIRPPTYPMDGANAIRWFTAPASAFAWNDNCIEVRALPTVPGQAASVEIRPASSRITVINRTRSVARGGSTGLTVTREVDSNTIIVSGSYSSATAWNPLSIHSQPDLLAGDHMARLFRAGGLGIDGEVRLGTAPARATMLLEQRDPLLPALTILNQRSQNFYGEQILRVIAKATGQPGSVAAGNIAVTNALTKRLGTGHGFVIFDGSGMSYDNRCTSAEMVRLLISLRSSYGTTFTDTLKPRPVGTRNALVKTGSLAHVVSLCGFTTPAPGQPALAFAIICNVKPGNSIAWAPALRDALLTTIMAGP